MTKVQVISGDVNRVKADALITPVGNHDFWFGMVNVAIRKVAGFLFHLQIAKTLFDDDFLEGETAVALSYDYPHKGKFTNVVFVIDNLRLPLHEIVHNGLKTADVAGFKSVSLPISMPIIRMDTISQEQEIVDEIAKGVKEFLKRGGLDSITLVVDNDPKMQKMLEAALE